MGFSIRSAEVEGLARELARRRGSTMTEAIKHALRKDLDATPSKRPLGEAIEEIVQEIKAMAGPNRRDVTKDEIDELWGQ